MLACVAHQRFELRLLPPPEGGLGLAQLRVEPLCQTRAAATVASRRR
jgi:hypothetical protein